MVQATGDDPQVAFVAGIALELVRRVKSDRLYGTFAVEFRTEKGEIVAVESIERRKSKPPASGMKH